MLLWTCLLRRHALGAASVLPILSCVLLPGAAGAGVTAHEKALAAPGASPDLLRYLECKRRELQAPADLVARLFPDPGRPGARQGGEGPDDATAIDDLPYTDTGTTAGHNNTVGPYDINGIWCAWPGYYSSQMTGAAPDVFYRLELEETAELWVSLCQSGWDTALGIFVDNDGELGQLVAGNDDECGLTSEVTTCPLPAGAYFIVVDGWGNSTGAYTLEVAATAIDCDAYEEEVGTATAPFVFTGSTAGMPHVYGGVGGDAGLEITLPQSGQWNFDACRVGTDYGAALFLLDASPCAEGTLLHSSTWSDCVPQDRGRIENIFLEAGTYHLVVSSLGNGEGNFEAAVEPTPPRPTQGGPDAFGYRWISSLDPGGPAFEFIDIAEIGSPGAYDLDTNLGPFELGFPMFFYGTFFEQVRVCSKAFLSFTSTSTQWINDPIPTTTEPNNLIACYWDDFDARQQGQILTWSDPEGGMFIMQFDEVPAYFGNVPFTFQAVLYPSGLIRFNYLDMDENNAAGGTVGLENATGAVGLEAVFDGDGAWIGDGISLLFLPPSDCSPVDCAGEDESEPNEGWGDGNQSWNTIRCGDTRCGTVRENDAGTDTDWYLYTHFGGDITATLDVSDFDGRLSLRHRDPAGGTVEAANVYPRCFDESLSATDLPPGAYYLVVEHAGDPDVTDQSYALSLSCGGDPCSGHLPIECAGTPEAEPNEGWSADPPNSSWGEIAPGETVCGTVWADGGTRDMDWFRFHLDAAVPLTLSCVTDAFDASLFITDFAPEGNIVGAVDDNPACAPETLTLESLPAGDYHAVIIHNAQDGVPVPQAYALTLVAGGAADPCEGVVELGEFHDVVHVSRPAPMAFHHDGTGCPGGVNAPGLDEVVRFSLAASTDLEITLEGAGAADEVILLLGDCAEPVSSCGAAADAAGPGAGGESLILPGLPAGDYYAVADFAGAGETHAYTLVLRDMNSGLDPRRPAGLALAAHPNPFNPATTLAWTQPAAAQVVLELRDLRGALVEQRDLGMRAAGSHQWRWEAADQGSGVYLVSLRAGEARASAKVLLLK